MRFDIITLFPALFAPFFDSGVIGRAFGKGLATAKTINLRDYADENDGVDDRPFGGGSGMVLAAKPVVAAIRERRRVNPNAPVVYPTPRGRLFCDKDAREMAKLPGMIILCGRYRGVDERALAAEVDMEISLGDYVLSGGEIAAMAIMDAVLRHRHGVLGNPHSADEESFAGDGLLDAPCYTRPAVFEGAEVPPVLLSGDHSAICRWRRAMAQQLTDKKTAGKSGGKKGGI
ncbi:MAG: tRNA (guanosine(37)-N1)-methyltransferase TrmD [Gammaproteobacteria bacterium]